MQHRNINEELAEAVDRRHLEAVRTLLAAGANPNSRSLGLQKALGGTLLNATDMVEIAKELLAHGAVVDSRNICGETPLHVAAKGNLSLVKELLKYGANVNARTYGGLTPLSIAVERYKGDCSIIGELLEYGADINLRDQKYERPGISSAPLAHVLCYPECARFLVKITLFRHLERKYRNMEKDYRKVVDLDLHKDSFFYPHTSSYLNSCIQEIMKMKTHNIFNKFSMYEFITTVDMNKRAMIYSKGIQNGPKVPEVLAKYPIYSDLLLRRMMFSLNRRTLLNQLKELQVYTKVGVTSQPQGVQGKTIALDPYSKYEISRYLSNADLSNFVIAFTDYGDYFNHIIKNTDRPSCSTGNVLESSQSQPKTKLSKASTSGHAKRAKLE